LFSVKNYWLPTRMHPISQKICTNCEKLFLHFKSVYPNLAHFRVIFAKRLLRAFPDLLMAHGEPHKSKISFLKSVSSVPIGVEPFSQASPC
jgi:hypothetical protein